MTPSSKALIVAAFLLTPSAARADADEGARATARALAQSGDEAFAGGRCDKASPLWQGTRGRCVTHAMARWTTSC